jgi:hypothetical protein
MRRVAPAEARVQAQVLSNRFVRGGMRAATLILLLALTTANAAHSQSCPLSPRVPFDGHNLPLDTPPDIQSMELVRVFPNLRFAAPSD